MLFHIVRSVSAWFQLKIKMPSSARLDSELFQLGLAQLGKFQLEVKQIANFRAYLVTNLNALIIISFSHNGKMHLFTIIQVII